MVQRGIVKAQSVRIYKQAMLHKYNAHVEGDLDAIIQAVTRVVPCYEEMNVTIYLRLY